MYIVDIGLKTTFKVSDLNVGIVGLGWVAGAHIDTFGAVNGANVTAVCSRREHNPSDLEDRELWPEFMDAYETAVQRCSTEHAPWYIVPADSRTRLNAMIARIVRGTLEDMNLSWPDPGNRLEDFNFD